MPLSATDSRAQLADTARNPRETVAGLGLVVNVELVFDGVSFHAEDLYDALDTQFGTVKLDTDTAGQRNFRFRISA